MLVYAAGYYLLGKLGYQFWYLNLKLSAIWPPTGVSLAVLLLWGSRWWPGVLIGSLLLNLDLGILPGAAIGIAASNACGVLTSCWLVERFARGKRAFEQSRTIFLFALLVGIGTSASATLGMMNAFWGGPSIWTGFSSGWITWWLADLTSCFLLTPFIVIWVVNPCPQWRSRRYTEGLGLLLLLVLLNLAIFCGTTAIATVEQSEWLVILPLLWAAFRFGQHGAISAMLLIFLTATWGFHLGHGPFISANRVGSIHLLQFYVGTMSMTSLILVAIMSELKRAQQAAQASEGRFRLMFDTMLQGVVVHDGASTELPTTATHWNHVWT